MTTTQIPTDDTNPLVIREVNALIKYASEKSLDPQGDIIRPLNFAIMELCLAEKKIEIKSESPMSSEDLAIIEDLRTKIIVLSSQLTKLSYPVTGRTLIQTAENFKSSIRPLKFFAFLFLVLVIGNEILKPWLGDIPEPEEGWLLLLINLQRYVLNYCTPFIWGALGSITYIMKRLSDYAEERTFDFASSQGWAIRIFLGAMLGGAVQFIYDPSAFIGGGSGLKMSANALGFLTGVGVKVVYGAIEKTIDTLATKMNLDAIRVAKGDNKPIRAYLNEQLAKTDKKEEPEKRKILLALIDNLEDPKNSSKS